MWWLLRRAPWQASLLVGLALLGYGGYRLAGHHGGSGSWLLTVAGLFVLVRSLPQARRGRSRP